MAGTEIGAGGGTTATVTAIMGIMTTIMDAAITATLTAGASIANTATNRAAFTNQQQGANQRLPVAPIAIKLRHLWDTIHLLA